MHAGVYDGRRHNDGSHSVESMQYVQFRIWRHYGERRQQRMHYMRGGILQSDGQQCGVHGMHAGVYDERRHGDGSHSAEPMQRVCG
jgi:hypothetical protein